MENYSFTSYLDSGESSPHSREIDFKNPLLWDDQPHQNYKVKFMCSYGGKIHPRPYDNQNYSITSYLFFFFFFFFLNLNFSLNLRRYNLTQCVSAVSAWVDTNRPDLAHIGKRKKKGHSTNARQRRRLRVTSLDAVRRPFCHVCASQMIICN